MRRYGSAWHTAARLRLDLALHTAPKAEFVLFVRKILDVDDNLTASCRRRRMLASLDLGHNNLVRKIHQRVVLHRVGPPATIEDVDAV